MKFSGILLDIDNTIYDYKITHEKAINAVFNYAEKLEMYDFHKAYISAHNDINLELAETASSHNRLLYFQRTCEYMKTNPLEWAINFYNVYWDTFLDSIVLREGVLDFLKATNKKIPICFVTDLTAHIQYRKINKMNLSKYVSCIVTSEEAGREKPHPYIFLLALKKLKLGLNDVCMIGDSYKKDIIGASSLGIKSIWLNNDFKQENYDKANIVEVSSFKEILGMI